MVGDAQLVCTRYRVLQVLRFCRGYPHSVDDISHLSCAVATYQKNVKITRKLYFKKIIQFEYLLFGPIPTAD